MTVYFTADTHFGHPGILEMASRPFADVTEHDAFLIEQWNARVRPGDTVWHLGDFAYRCGEDYMQRVFAKLHGDKRLIVGNHDIKPVRRLGWGGLHHYHEVAVDGQRLILFHYGLRVWNAMWRGSIQLYGHSHGRLAGNSRSLDVGVDAWAFAPVTWPEIRQRLETLPAWQNADDGVGEDDDEFEPMEIKR